MEEDYEPTNREKCLEPKTAKFWCDGCDAELVGIWEKCPKCGYRSGRKRYKKPT